MSPSAEALLAISLRKAHQIDISSFTTGDGLEFGEHLRKAIHTGQVFTHRDLNLVLTEQKKDITVDCTLSTVTQDNNDFLIIEMSLLDRIKRIAKEEKLINQQHASREVVRGMAHEIKNPLGGIRGAAQLLERELQHEEQKEFTEIIISEVDRLQTLVDRMLGPNRLPKKKLQNIHEIIDHVIRLLDIESDKNIRFIKDFDPSLPELLADRDQLIQAIINIVRNAWEAMRDAGMLDNATITIKTRAVRRFTLGYKTHRLVLAVSIIDTGPGIPSDLVEQIFYPMVTGRSEGTGLGLAISQTLISQHNGIIECESQPGQTKFTLYLPIDTQDVKNEK